MRTDWKALAAELAVELERCRPLAEMPDCLARARAALAEQLNGTDPIRGVPPLLAALAALAADPVADGPAVQSREPASVVGEPSDEELLDIAAQAIDGYSSGIKLGEYEAENEIAVEAYGSELITFARAAISRYGHQPAPPAGELLKEAAWLRNECSAENADGNWISMSIDQALDLASLLERQAAPVPVPAAVGEAAHIRRMCEIILGNTFGNEELDSLALLVGHHPDVLNAFHVPTEEVGELAVFLRDAAFDLNGSDPAKSMLTRAADLLEQRHPAPVPVNERLPGPEDCDGEGRCWWGRPESDDWSADWTLTTQEAVDTFCAFSPRVYWLPATALPIPAGEVE